MAQRSEYAKIAHLLRRFGLGASQEEMKRLEPMGLNRAIDWLLDYENQPVGPMLDIDKFKLPNKAQPDMPLLPPYSVKAYWATRLLNSQRPLEEKMTLFWHDHFATSDLKVNSGQLMYQQNELLRKDATSSFRTLLESASKDPAMLFWLDGHLNVKGHAQENFGREVMELFTLGVDNGYTEKDIQEAARAFTGWTFKNRGKNPAALLQAPRLSVYEFADSLHDEGEKTVLGKTGKLTGDDVLDILCDNPQTSRYITSKIWKWFVYPNPSNDVIDKHAKVFRDSGLSIKKLIRSIVTDDEFYSNRAFWSVYKNPVDFIVPVLRQLGVGARGIEGYDLREKGTRQVQAVIVSTKSMGMELLNPPDVDGWQGGAAWISSGTMIERMRLADRLWAPRPKTNNTQVLMTFSAIEWIPEGIGVEQAVKTFVDLFNAPVPDSRMQNLVNAARDAAGGSTITRANANATARVICRLIFGSPEFQLM